jgi:hypothetical protein
MKWKHTGESSTTDFVATAKSILGMPGSSVEDKVQQILATWKAIGRCQCHEQWGMGSAWWN